MKKLFVTITFATLSIAFLNSNQLRAEDTKKVLADKSFSINPDADLVINHEHGNVYCNNWDKNEILVTIIAYANTNDTEKAEKAFQRINWEAKGNNNEVIIQSKLTGKSGGGSPNVWTDIEINFPKSINLNLRHKFGKAFIETVDGIALITSDYGSITVNKINNPESKFKVTYGDGQINTFSGGSLIVQYSQLTFDEAGDVSIRSEYSDVKGDEAGHILIKLEGGSLNLDKINSIKGNSSFSSINIDELSSSIDITTGYGSFNADHVSENFTEINVENNFGSVNLGIPASSSYIFDATATHGSIMYPEDLANINYQEKTTQKTILKGKIGQNSNAASKVTLKSNYGSINIVN